MTKLQSYSALFGSVGREGVHASVSRDGEGYHPVRTALTKANLVGHVRGKEGPYGVYLMHIGSATRCLVFDIDGNDEPAVRKITGQLIRHLPDSAILVEQTGGRGWHIWLFFEEPVSAADVRRFAKRILVEAAVGYPVEIYPRQDTVAEGGLGNLVRLPLGRHPRTGKTGVLYSVFMQELDTKGEIDPELPIQPCNADILAAALKWAEAAVPAAKARPGAAPEDDAAARGGTLPCISSYMAGIPQGFRDEGLFRLAAYLKRQGAPKEAALVSLKVANDNSPEPMTEKQLIQKADSAYKEGVNFGLPCSSDLVGLDSQFCSPNCPVYAKAKARAEGREGDLGRYPRIEQTSEGLVYQTMTNAGVREALLANFTLEPVSVLQMSDVSDIEEVIRVRVEAVSGMREQTLDLPLSAFHSRSNLLRSLPAADFAWFGNDQQAQMLKAWLLEQGEVEVPRRRAITKLGRPKNARIWVFPDAIVGVDGVLEGDEWEYVRPPHYGRVDVASHQASMQPDEFIETLRSLDKVNNPEVVYSTLGWTFAVPFKPYVVGTAGHFPLLMLFGTRGSGKTQMVQRSILPLFGYSVSEPQAHVCDSTRFVWISYGASTTTVPVFMDEYRPSALGMMKVRSLWDFWRHAFSESTDHRGQSNLTRLSFQQTSPLVIAGEEMVLDPALIERFIQVQLSVDNLTDAHKLAFTELPDLSRASLPFVQGSLAQDQEALWSEAKETVAKLKLGMSPRIQDNLAVTVMGLLNWSRLANTKMPKDAVEALLSLPGLVGPTGGGRRTSLWVDEFVLDLLSMVEEKGPFTWGQVEREAGQLTFNLRGAHAAWSKEVRQRGDSPLARDTLRRQLHEDSSTPYVTERNVQRKLAGVNRRVYVVDLTELERTVEE